MNLAIVYLVRTGVIKKLFRPPQSFFVKNRNQRFVVSIEEEPNHPDSYHVVHWNLSVLADNGLPQQQCYFVPKTKLFSSNHIVLSRFSLLSYEEQPLDTNQNNHTHPMKADVFEASIKNYLNSEHHQRIRTLLLWCSFTNNFFNKPFAAWENIDILDHAPNWRRDEYERFVVYQEHPEKWDIWCRWKEHMLLTGQVAGELIFMPVYQTIRWDDMF